jgi:hypothetical protein
MSKNMPCWVDKPAFSVLRGDWPMLDRPKTFELNDHWLGDLVRLIWKNALVVASKGSTSEPWNHFRE